MAAKSQPSFTPGRRWKIGIDVVLRSALVLAVMVMLNYLGARFFHRFYLSSQTNVGLSTRSLAVLHSLTNQMTVTLYYDTHDPENFFPTLLALANEYHAANKNISVRAVDYMGDPGAAETIKAQYNLPGAANSPGAPPAKDLIIFACGDRHDVVPGETILHFQTGLMATNDPDYDPNQKQLQFSKRPVAFNGEVIFTSKLLALAHAQPFKACYLQGHGEASLADAGDGGFSKFGQALAQNDILPENLELLGDTEIPADCNLLIIAGPSRALRESELQKIDRYLAQGGRLLALFSYASIKQPTGLEPILTKWGVNVLPTYVKDPQSSNGSDQVVLVRKFNPKTFVNPLTQFFLEMVLPRPVGKVEWANPPQNAPQVDELVISSAASTLAGNPADAPQSYPLIAAVEQKPGTGVAATLGQTRIIVAGDSLFLDNQFIEAGANRDFLNYAANWLLDRQELLSGISPHPVKQFRLLLSQKQNQQLDWLLLAALPGGVMALGWLVWLARRK